MPGYLKSTVGKLSYYIASSSSFPSLKSILQASSNLDSGSLP